jgi:hypothetical protein
VSRDRERDTPFSAQLAIGFNARLSGLHRDHCREDICVPCAAKLQESKLLGTKTDLPVSACLAILSAVNDIVRSEYGNSLPQSRHTS